MPFNLLIFTTRRADLTFQQFKQHYENNHAPLASRLFGENAPEGYVRYYVDRSESDTTSNIWILGSPSDFDYDCCTVLTWHDEAAWEAAKKVFATQEVQKPLVEDEERFLDRSKTKMMVVGEGFGSFPPTGGR